MKGLTKSALLGLYKYSGAMAAQERLARWSGRSFLSILLFHRVTDEIPPDGLTVSTAWFRGLCRLLRRRFHVISVAQAVDLLDNGAPLPPRTVAITFDDCYRDNLFAARTLAEFKLPACFFIPTAFPGTDHVFAWDQGLKRLTNLRWNDIREMADLGHAIGSHTVHHADIAQLSVEETRRELIDSKQTLETQLGRPVELFAYPFGGRGNFPPERLAMVYEAGYRACFSGYGGFVCPWMKGEIIPRLAVPYFRSLLNLEVHLTGCLDWVYSIKRKAGMIAS
jgi:peptidoglycan/xylan/chitin deacetylase (PgdA/CDA1 family)